MPESLSYVTPVDLNAYGRTIVEGVTYSMDIPESRRNAVNVTSVQHTFSCSPHRLAKTLEFNAFRALSASENSSQSPDGVIEDGSLLSQPPYKDNDEEAI